MPDFTPDPRSCVVAHLDDVPYEWFGELPDHPAQRQTPLHAANLLASGVLTPALDQHCLVDAVLVGDPDMIVVLIRGAYRAQLYFGCSRGPARPPHSR